MENREIKFRAWDKLNNVMIDMHAMEYFAKTETRNQERFYLMQYTGLKDKNGKRIYDGDIVEFYFDADYGYDVKNATKMIDEVYFENGCFYMRLVKEPEIGSAFLFRHNKNCEVIGNIYEE